MELQSDGSINIDVGSDYSVLDESWVFRLKATSSESSTDSTVEYDFTMNHKDGCLFDSLSDLSTIDNFVYYLDDTGLYTVSAPTFTQLVPNC